MTKFKQTLPEQQIREWIWGGLSMSEVARRLGKHVATISKFCARKDISSKYSSAEKPLPMDEVINRYRDGVSLYELSNIYSRPANIIKKKLVKSGIKIRNMDEVKRPPELNDKDVLAELMSLYSLTKIAKRLGTKVNTVSAAAKRHGLSDMIIDQSIGTEEDEIEIGRLYMSGHSTTEIAKVYGTYAGTICNILKRNGIELRPAGGSPRDSKHEVLNDPEWLREEYEQKQRSMASIAAEVGTSLRNISYYLNKYGIPKRSKTKVYRKLRREQSKVGTVNTKWGNFKLASNQERLFIKSLDTSIGVVEHEPQTFDAGNSQYTPDFRVDGEYVEIKPTEFASHPGVDRQRFIKQYMVAKLNNISLKVWYKGRYHIVAEPSDEDRYFALDWKLFFKTPIECHKFLCEYGFKPIEYNEDSLLFTINKLTYMPREPLNANSPAHKIIQFIHHFNHHFWLSSHKGYMCIADAFGDGNKNLLKNVVHKLWQNNNNCNIYGLVKLIAKFYKDFATVSVFKPWVARHIYNKYLPNGGIVVDPCIGWGGRLLGTVGLDIKYVGSDLNQNSVDSAIKMSKFVGNKLHHKPELTVKDASVEISRGDLLLTSPPYDDREYYNGLSNQCKDASPIYTKILTEFDGIIILNVPRDHEPKCLEIASKCARKLIDRLEMKTASFMGRERTFEPILVFK